MTIDEAIKYLNNPLSWAIGKTLEQQIADNKEATQMAIDALEKQIPMKPMHPQMGIDGRKIIPCGYCEEELPKNMAYDYCPYCGQRIER